MLYAKITGGAVSKYPYTMKDLRRDNKNVSFPVNSFNEPAIRDEYGVAEVEETERPSKAGYHTVEGSPQLSGGKYVATWEFVAKTAEELQSTDLVLVETPPAKEGYRIDAGSPEFVEGEWRQTWNYVEITDWLEGRMTAYDAAKVQIEFITENGLEAWQSKVEGIKAKYPKP